MYLIWKYFLPLYGLPSTLSKLFFFSKVLSPWMCLILSYYSLIQQKFLILMKLIYLFFPLLPELLVPYLINCSPIQGHETFPLPLLFGHSVVSNSATPWTTAHQSPCPSLCPRVCSDSCPLCWWCYLIILCSTALFSCLQSFPTPGSFPMSRLFASGGQNIEVWVLISVLPMNIQGWFPLGLTGFISLQTPWPYAFKGRTTMLHGKE